MKGDSDYGSTRHMRSNSLMQGSSSGAKPPRCGRGMTTRHSVPMMTSTAPTGSEGFTI